MLRHQLKSGQKQRTRVITVCTCVVYTAKLKVRACAVGMHYTVLPWCRAVSCFLHIPQHEQSRRRSFTPRTPPAVVHVLRMFLRPL